MSNKTLSAKASVERKVRWTVRRVIDERTQNSLLKFTFPNRLGDRGYAIVDDDLSENPKKLRIELKKRGAAFTGSISAQVRFVGALVRAIPNNARLLPMKPGWRGDGFVLGGQLLEAAKKRCVINPKLCEDGLGARAEDLAAWKRDVAEPLGQSSSGSFGIMLGLAACLPTYAKNRQSKTPGLRPLISETFVLNFSGPSGSGRTVTARAVAGLYGSPDAISDFHLTRRGLEELAEARNDLVLVLDDTEKYVDEKPSLKTVLRWVNEIIPSGHSKKVATSATDTTPRLHWSTFGLSSSPVPIDQLAEELGWKRSAGERVRMPNISVPAPSEGGILDNLPGDDVDKAQASNKRIKELEVGVAANSGVAFPAWVHWLLEKNRALRVQELIDKFVRIASPDGDGWDKRFAAKFGICYAAGKLAVEAGILPWPSDWPFKAAVKCYRNAMQAIRSDAQSAELKIRVLAAQISKAKGLIRM